MCNINNCFFFTLAELLNMTVSLSGKGWWYWINLQGLSLSWRCWLHYVACSLALLYLILPGIILSRQSNPIRREIRRRIWLISKKKTYWKRKHSYVSVMIHIIYLYESLLLRFAFLYAPDKCYATIFDNLME